MLAIGTNDGIVCIERYGNEWALATKALEGIRIDAVSYTHLTLPTKA